jgi:uncharacterized protein YacL
MVMVWVLRLAFIGSAAAAGYLGVAGARSWGALAGGAAAVLLVLAEAGFSWRGLQTARPSEKILDTSVIIDGRVADICQTGIIEGDLVVPRFVLQELQRVADSSDALKRNRGRRGLDTLAALQRVPGVRVRIVNRDFPALTAVDEKLLRLAKRRGGKLVTNDINLNKLAGLQGVAVLNLNDLSNAIKTVVLPGEELALRILREGKEPGQGVGYLDDGTMVVVENGRTLINQRVQVTVTSVLQTTAGRMVFGRPRNGEGA